VEDDEEIDYEVATDDESLAIRHLEHELRSVSAFEDRKLYVWLGIGLVSILFYALKPGFITQILVITLIPLTVIGGIGSAIFGNIRKKKKILIKHGLQCKNCGFIPSAFNASGVLGSKKCLKCHSRLDI
jgi:predicted Zn-ribbon and HTH transcriptional regulator